MTIFKGLLGEEDVAFGTGEFQRRGRGGSEILVTQINAGSIPVIDASERFSGETVEAALGELLTAGDLSDALVAQALDELIESLGQDVVLSGGLYEYVAGMIDSSLDEALQTLYPLIDAAGLTGGDTVISDGVLGVPDVADEISGGLYEFVVNIVESAQNQALQTVYPLIQEAATPLWLGRRFHWAFSAGGNYPVTNIISNFGTVLTRATSTGGVDKSTAYEQFSWVRATAAATRAGWTTNLTTGEALEEAGTTFDFFEKQPFVWGRCQVDSIVDARVSLSLGGAVISHDDTSPWITTGRGGLAFVFGSATSANWRAIGKVESASAAAFNVDTGVPVEANRIYTLAIVVRGVGSNRVANFYIDGYLVYAHTTTTDYSNNTGLRSHPDWNAFITNAASPLQLSVSQMVWGINHTRQIGKAMEFLTWITGDPYYD